MYLGGASLCWLPIPAQGNPGDVLTKDTALWFPVSWQPGGGGGGGAQGPVGPAVFLEAEPGEDGQIGPPGPQGPAGGGGGGGVTQAQVDAQILGLNLGGFM